MDEIIQKELCNIIYNAYLYTYMQQVIKGSIQPHYIQLTFLLTRMEEPMNIVIMAKLRIKNSTILQNIRLFGNDLYNIKP